MGSPAEDARPAQVPAQIVVRPATPRLRAVVSSMGYLQGSFSHDRELAVPSGTMQLLVNLDRDELHSYALNGAAEQRTSGVAVQGPYSGPALIDPANQRAIVWVAFRLGGAHPFLPAPAAATRDQLVDLSELWGQGAGRLREHLLSATGPLAALRRLEDILLSRALWPVHPDPATVVAARALHRGATVSETADRLGWTTKRLGRLFAEQVGLSPKRFARVRRFQRLLARATSVASSPAAPGAGVDWARLAAECGYHDQSHLVHEFRDLAAMTPTQYRPRSPGEHNHVPLDL